MAEMAAIALIQERALRKHDLLELTGLASAVIDRQITGTELTGRYRQDP